MRLAAAIDAVTMLGLSPIDFGLFRYRAAWCFDSHAVSQLLYCANRTEAIMQPDHGIPLLVIRITQEKQRNQISAELSMVVVVDVFLKHLVYSKSHTATQGSECTNFTALPRPVAECLFLQRSEVIGTE